MNSRKKAPTTSFTVKDHPFFSWIRLAAWLAIACFTISALGCASTTQYEYYEVPELEMQAYLHDKPEQLHSNYRRILHEGPRNLVLNHMETGLAAMDLGAYEKAEESLETALLNIESVWAENKNAERARSLWYEEGRKDFKGEPYERAMAYYYRGLLFLRRGDYENARASFKGGQLQDALAEDKKYQDDFALLMFLEGWASQMNGDWDMAKEAYDHVKEHRPDFILPNPKDNVLLIAETGFSPVKIATGPGGSELRIKRREGVPEVGAKFFIRNGVISAYEMEDIFWQASTRGGRKIDKILADKVEFKKSHGERGRALTQIGLAGVAVSARHRSEEGLIIAGILTALGLIEQGVAGAAQTRADNRFWKNLPDRVHVYTFQSETKPIEIEALFYDSKGGELQHLRSSKKIKFANNHSGLAWFRSRSAQLN